MEIKIKNSNTTYVVGKNVEVEPQISELMYFNQQGVIESATSGKRRIYYIKVKAGITYRCMANCSYNPNAVCGFMKDIPSIGNVADVYQGSLGSNINYSFSPQEEGYLFMSFYDSNAILEGTMKFYKNVQ